MVSDGIIISLILGFIRGGSLKGLATLKIKYGWVFIFLLALQWAIFFSEGYFSFIHKISAYSFIFFYIIGLFFLWMNRDLKGFKVVFAGVFLNFLVMLVNEGRMPVSLDAANIVDPSLIPVLKAGLYGKHFALTSGTKLPFLGDIIPLTKPYPKSQVISIGDIIMNIGIFLFIQNLMVKNKLKNNKLNNISEETNS